MKGMYTVNVTITTKVKLTLNDTQKSQILSGLNAYRAACNYLSKFVFESSELSQYELHKIYYRDLREGFNLKGHAAQSVIKTVISMYKASKSNNHKWTLINFSKLQYDLVYNNGYSMKKDVMSIGFQGKRIKVPFELKGNHQFFDGSWKLGTAKVVIRNDKFYLHIPVTKEYQDVSTDDINNIVGIDFGINFLAVTYDSNEDTLFFKGKNIKNIRKKYKNLRSQLMAKKSKSANKRLQKIGSRENRWMADVNHRVSKALVDHYGPNTLYVIEDLSGIGNMIKQSTKGESKYEHASWAFYQLRQFLEYKASLAGSTVIAVDPRFTSQACPKCGHTEKSNRDKKIHTFKCKSCNYTSNDDRTAAMNLHGKGLIYRIDKSTIE